MKLVVYGTLRSGGKFSFILPKAQLRKKITLKGFEMYDLINKPACKESSSKSDYIVAELLDYGNLSFIKTQYLLFILALLESTYIRKYKRYKILVEPNVYAYVYLYNWRISPKARKINNWIEEKT